MRRSQALAFLDLLYRIVGLGTRSAAVHIENALTRVHSVDVLTRALHNGCYIRVLGIARSQQQAGRDAETRIHLAQLIADSRGDLSRGDGRLACGQLDGLV